MPAVLAGAPSSAGTVPPCAVPRVALGSGSWRRRWDRAIPVDREEGQRRVAHGTLWNIGNSDDPGTGDDTVEKRGLIEFPGGLALYKNGVLRPPWWSPGSPRPRSICGY